VREGHLVAGEYGYWEVEQHENTHEVSVEDAPMERIDVRADPPPALAVGEVAAPAQGESEPGGGAEDAGGGVTSVGRLAFIFGSVAHCGVFDVFVDEPWTACA